MSLIDFSSSRVRRDITVLHRERIAVLTVIFSVNRTRFTASSTANFSIAGEIPMETKLFAENI